MSHKDKYLNSGNKLKFKDLEKNLRKTISRSDYKCSEKMILKLTLWHEFGHAKATIKEKQTLTSIRVDKWFIYFYDNNYGSIWTFDFLSNYFKKLKEYDSEKIKKMNEDNSGACFMTINDKLTGKVLRDTLKSILKARYRIIGIKQSGDTSDKNRIKDLENNTPQSNKAANDLKLILNDIGKLNIHSNSTDEQKINIYGRCAVIRWEHLNQQSFYTDYFSFFQLLKLKCFLLNDN